MPLLLREILDFFEVRQNEVLWGTSQRCKVPGLIQSLAYLMYHLSSFLVQNLQLIFSPSGHTSDFIMPIIENWHLLYINIPFGHIHFQVQGAKLQEPTHAHRDCVVWGRAGDAGHTVVPSCGCDAKLEHVFVFFSLGRPFCLLVFGRKHHRFWCLDRFIV